MPFPDNTYAFNFPVKQLNQFKPPNTFAPAGSMRARLPRTGGRRRFPRTASSMRARRRCATQAYFYVPPDLHEGSLHSWNVGVSTRAAGRWTLEVAYVGNRGHDIIATTEHERRAWSLGADNAGRPLFAPSAARPMSTTWVPVKTEYHSLQAKLDRRFSNGLLVTTSYTLGRSKNYSNGDSNGAIQTPADPERSWARRGEDRLHNFAASWVYHLPVGAQADGSRAARWATSSATGRSAASSSRSRARRSISKPTTPRCAHRATRSGRMQRHAGGARRHRPRQPLVRHVGVLGAGAEHVGQCAAQQPARRPGVRQCRCDASRRCSCCRTTSAASSASTPSTCSTSRISTIRTGRWATRASDRSRRFRTSASAAAVRIADHVLGPRSAAAHLTACCNALAASLT